MKLRNFWIHLPVTNQEKSLKFFKEIGFDVDKPTDENLARISLNDNPIILMNREKLFKAMEMEDSKPTINSLISMDVATNEEVDELAKKVEENGGKVIVSPTVANGYYGFLFEDPDGNILNVIVM